MPKSWKQFIAEAPKRDEEARRVRAAAEAREDARYDAISALIDEHPIGRPAPHGGAVADD
jgi:hypothetical protein